MTDPTPTEASPAMRRKADLMVGLFVGAVVALLGGVVVLATSGSTLGVGLLVAGVVIGAAGALVLRSISPEERERLTTPKPTDDGPAGEG